MGKALCSLHLLGVFHGAPAPGQGARACAVCVFSAEPHPQPRVTCAAPWGVWPCTMQGDSSVNVGAADAVHETPHMQKMADEGITFSDFHSSFSVCTASRGALLTGRLAPRTGVGNNFGPDSSFGMASRELTIADVLAGKGYESHMIGQSPCRALARPCRRCARRVVQPTLNRFDSTSPDQPHPPPPRRLPPTFNNRLLASRHHSCLPNGPGNSFVAQANGIWGTTRRTTRHTVDS